MQSFQNIKTKKQKGGERMKEAPHLKTCAVINDLSGFGRCALNVTIPVMSVQGIRVLAAPTAVLSNHTAFDEYYFSDLTGGMEEYFSNWEKLNLRYDGIYTGFLGSEEQVDIITRFIEKARGENTLLFVDPIMGDDGVLYSTYTDALGIKMRSLVRSADIITPNLTEACFLADVPYADMLGADDEKIFTLAEKLGELGAGCVIITGIYRSGTVSNFVFDAKTGEKFISSSKYIGREYCGTGDLFASLLVGYILQGLPLRTALDKTGAFVCEAVSLSEELGVSPTDGVAFEPILKNV